VLKESELFYGAYNPANLTLPDDGTFSTSKAYFFTNGVIYVLWTIILGPML
jgi:hypothetical protein